MPQLPGQKRRLEGLPHRLNRPHRRRPSPRQNHPLTNHPKRHPGRLNREGRGLPLSLSKWLTSGKHLNRLATFEPGFHPEPDEGLEPVTRG